MLSSLFKMTITLVSNERLLRLHLTGTLVSAVIYGLSASVFLHCLALLVTNRKNSYSNRTRYFLITYVVTMFSLSSVAMIQAFVFITRAIVHGVDPSSLNILQLNEPIALPFVIWGADGFMVCQFKYSPLFSWLMCAPKLWRCIMLYSSTESRFQRTVVHIILSLSGFVSFGKIGIHIRYST